MYGIDSITSNYYRLYFQVLRPDIKSKINSLVSCFYKNKFYKYKISKCKKNFLNKYFYSNIKNCKDTNMSLRFLKYKHTNK